ncbi:calcium ATPase transmembrane domain M-containing protein [Suillus subaureus]|uniref:Calcium ATPase transmembrane domain M-containing protein n=1 Tax=Suillus subaureus TaxID=48587 RepID=A0A9P7ENR0_9AGAM|nr:calcium ATPase transmembrane domain M-containing protein [Suillus subaureus]KAG1826819.1 calcium ATPase transmembrane domain M-containing protein [Suillus subaureus]
MSDTTSSPDSGRGSEKGYGIQIAYRTLSGCVEEKQTTSKSPPDPADTIGSIDAHLLSVDEVYIRYSTHPTVGLELAAVRRRERDGKNIISPPPTVYWKKMLDYIFGGFNFLMWISFILTILSYKPLGPPIPLTLGIAVLLIFVIVVSATFYALIDWNANRIMKSIKSLIAHEAAVIRDGNQQIIKAADIVVGDVTVLNAGDRVPADMRVVQASSDLRFDRSLLTGESATSNNALETRNLALTSTFVVQGTCHGVVFATGDRTVMGRLVKMSGETKFKLTTIQREVWFFTKIISYVALFFFCSSILLYGVWLRTSYPGYDTPSSAIVNSIGCLTAFVPQGLPVCVALSLTVVARRMAKRQVLVKNLATIETLGCMSVLCSDKTGTLTAGKMMVGNIAFLDDVFGVEDVNERVTKASDPTIARLCNGAKFDATTNHLPVQDRTVKGDPTDTALLRFSEALSIPELGVDASTLQQDYQKKFEIPFNSSNKWMLSVVSKVNIAEKNVDSTWMFIKGAPEVLFPSCSSVLQSDGTVVKLTSRARQTFATLQEDWSSRGQRVLVLCRKPIEEIKTGLPPNDVEDLMYMEMCDLTLVGLIGIYDPPRPDVSPSISIIRRAGVRVFMVTGDFKLTALAIARQVGIITQHVVDTIQDVRAAASEKVSPKDYCLSKPSDDDPICSLVLTGEDVASLTSFDWNVVVGAYTEIVFARTTPDQKMRIVEEIKARGDNTVAVTGDGVNDAPALKAADIGVAMGSGSDVAKEAAVLILLNNDFASIPVAIELGRLVFDNLKKVTLYLMPGGSYAQFMAIVANVLLGMQLPLNSYQQTCYSITNDVIMSISLMYEKPEWDLMQRKPRNARTDRLTGWRFFLHIYLFYGLMLWPCAMAMWFLYMNQQGLSFYKVILTFNQWEDGWQGYTLAQLTQFVNVGQGIYYVTVAIGQCGTLLAVSNRRVSILHSNPLWGPRRNLLVLVGMIGTILICIVNLYGAGFQRVFGTTPIPGMFWGLPFTFALGILLVDETRKAIVRKYPKSFIAWLAW